MDTRNKFRRMVFTRGSKIVLALGLTFVTQCAPVIKGKISDLDGNKLYSDTARVNVTPLSTGTKERSQLLQMDSDGTFKTKNPLTKGSTYMVEVLLPGYEIFSKEVTVQNDLVMDLKLKPLKKVETKTISIDMDVDANRGSGGATLTPPKF